MAAMANVTTYRQRQLRTPMRFSPLEMLYGQKGRNRHKPRQDRLPRLLVRHKVLCILFLHRPLARSNRPLHLQRWSNKITLNHNLPRLRRQHRYRLRCKRKHLKVRTRVLKRHSSLMTPMSFSRCLTSTTEMEAGLITRFSTLMCVSIQ